MTIHGHFITRLLLVFVFFIGMREGLALGDSIMSENKVPGQVESKARRLMHDLKKEGFEVSRGYFKLWTAELRVYLREDGHVLRKQSRRALCDFAVPPWPDEFVDPVTAHLWRRPIRDTMTSIGSTRARRSLFSGNCPLRAPSFRADLAFFAAGYL